MKCLKEKREVASLKKEDASKWKEKRKGIYQVQRKIQRRMRERETASPPCCLCVECGFWKER
jgi:hypothetical protein